MQTVLYFPHTKYETHARDSASVTFQDNDPWRYNGGYLGVADVSSTSREREVIVHWTATIKGELDDDGRTVPKVSMEISFSRPTDP
jgi:hypothetical protein